MVVRPAHKPKMLDLLSRRGPEIAIYAGGLVQVYLMFLAVDSMLLYSAGIAFASPIIRLASLALITVVLVHSLINTKHKRLTDLLLLGMIAYTLMGLAIGLLNENNSYAFGRHLFASSTMTICYWLGLILSDALQRSRKALNHVSIATFLGCLFFILVAALSGNLGKPNTNLNASNPLLFVLDASLLQGQVWLVCACLLIILSTNLRSGMFGAAVMLSSYLLLRYAKGYRPAIRVLLAAALSTALFLLSSFVIIGVDKILTAYGTYAIGERVMRTKSAVSNLFPKDKSAERTDVQADSPDIESLSTGRLSQVRAVYNSINRSAFSLLFGPGFGSEFSWIYYSQYLKEQQAYVMHQSDMMVSQFMLTGGLLFAALLTILIGWKTLLVFLNSTSSNRLGGLFVLGFGFSMFFGFQPNVPLYWLFLGALSSREKL